ncbi:MAG: hypothetical protein JSW41_04655 [Candidatus Aenigmatarchaeota archaeon]|nr:MAG: hypothetical protein JSW41_04655 [Candidatus Aenigmarchaeota archaeon]
MKNLTSGWTEELILEFGEVCSGGQYGPYKGCRTRPQKLEKFKELNHLKNMERAFNGHGQEGWPKAVPNSSTPQYVYIRVKKNITKDCWYKDLGGRVFKALNKLHFGFAGHRGSYVTQISSTGTASDGIDAADVEILARNESTASKVDMPELTLEDLRKVVGPFKLKVE